MTTQVATPVWAEAQDALRDMVGRLTAMMRAIPDATAAGVGQWSVAEVAMHLSQAWVAVPGLARGDISEIYQVVPSAAATPGDSLIGDVWELGEATKQGVASDQERNVRVLADRIDARAAAFFADAQGKLADEPRPWLVAGITVPRWVLTCHLLNETIVHGYDMAKSAGVKWKIDRPYAAIVLRGFIVQVINALEPHAMVDQAMAAGLHLRYDLRLRGSERVTFVFDDGALHIDGPATERVDCHISADPAALLLVTWARQSQWSAIARGKLLAWGRKPWLGPKFRSLMRNP
jgi:hypothetical protein